MTFVRRAFLRMRAVFGRQKLNDDMQAEMREHIDRATERLIARGMSPGEARHAARREFGNLTVLQDDAGDARGARWVDALTGDLRFALRYFARHKATVAIIVVVLALGTGANTVIFSVFQSQFLRPAPGVPDDDSHARIWGQQRDTRLAAWHDRGFTHPELTALAQRADVFRDVAGWTSDQISFAADSGVAQLKQALYVTPNFFATLAVRPIAGQGLARDAGDVPDRTAVLAEAVATRLYGSAASAVGRTVLVNAVPLRIVGVAPPRFQGATKNMVVAIWIPMSARADIARVSPRWSDDEPRLSLFARLAPGASHEQASALATQVAAGTLPDSASRVGMSRSVRVQPMSAPSPSSRREMMLMLAVMAAIGILILLVGWMNVSSLMVAAAVARRHEIAVRLSMGASRARILLQLVTESTMLALGGGLVGLLVAWWILMYAGADGGMELTPDLGTVAFTLLFALATGILFGLSPALHATRGQLSSALRDSKSGGVGRARLQRFFVSAQIMLSQPLLVLLGVFISLVIYVYEPHAPSMSGHVIKVEFRPLQGTGGPGQRREAVDSIVPRIAQRAEVRGVVNEAGPFEARLVKSADGDATAPRADSALTLVQLVGAQPGWFALVDIPILLGRDVSWGDTASAERAVVIGSDLARRLWGDAHPIGRRLASPARRGTEQDSIALTVVGVYDATHRLTDAAFEGEHGDSTPHMITAHGRHWRADEVLVRTRAPAEPFLPEMQRYVRDQAPSLPVIGMRTLAQIDAEQYSASLKVSAVIAASGAAALLLASLGLYGVVSLAVQQRTREIGIRIAVGGRPRAVARMFLLSGVRVSAVGLMLGLPLSMAALKLAKSQGVFPDAPAVNVGVIGGVITLLLLGVSAAATWLPARRAAQVDPASTLRVD
jgi:putative ABC transport system permease protein